MEIRCRKFCKAVLISLNFIVATTCFGQGGAPGFGGWQNPKADNKNHYVCWNSSGTYPSEAVSYGAWWQSTGKNSTGLTLIPHVPNICYPLDDAMLNDDLTGGYYGLHTCTFVVLDAIDGYICLEGHVAINVPQLTYISNTLFFPYSEAAYKTWCHEMGHSYGIWHGFWGNDSCMSNQMLPGMASTYTNDELVLMQFYIP